MKNLVRVIRDAVKRLGIVFADLATVAEDEFEEMLCNNTVLTNADCAVLEIYSVAAMYLMLARKQSPSDSDLDLNARGHELIDYQDVLHDRDRCAEILRSILVYKSQSDGNETSITPRHLGRRLVFLCGGTAISGMAKQLRAYTSNITLLINAYDDGKSTGETRKVFDVFGPSDIGKNLCHSLSDQSNAGVKAVTEFLDLRLPQRESNVNRLEDLEFSRVLRLELEQIIRVGPECAVTCLSKIKEKWGSLAKQFPEHHSRLREYFEHFFFHLDSATEKNQALEFADMSLRNLLVIGAFFRSGKRYEDAIDSLATFLRCEGKLLLNSLENRYIFAYDTPNDNFNWELIETEGDVVEFQRKRPGCLEVFFAPTFLKVKEVKALNRVKGSTGRSRYLYTNYSRSVSPNPRVAEILLNSDGIVYGPTTLYASLIPTLMTAGIDRMISSSAGPKILVANLFREGDPFATVSTQIREIVRYLAGRDPMTITDVAERKRVVGQYVDYVIVNNHGFSYSPLPIFSKPGIVHPSKDQLLSGEDGLQKLVPVDKREIIKDYGVEVIEAPILQASKAEPEGVWQWSLDENLEARLVLSLVGLARLGLRIRDGHLVRNERFQREDFRDRVAVVG